MWQACNAYEGVSVIIIIGEEVRPHFFFASNESCNVRNVSYVKGAFLRSEFDGDPENEDRGDSSAAAARR